MQREILQNYQSYLIILGFAGTTIRTKIRRVECFLNWLDNRDIKEIGKSQIKEYYQYLQAQKSESQIRTINLYMLNLDQFYSWACELSIVENHPFVGILLEKTEETNSRTPLSLEQIKQLYQACESLEEKVLLIFSYGCGLRASELQSLKAKDILLTQSLVKVESGKNSKRRYIPINGQHLDIISQYISNKNLVNESYLFQYKTIQKSQYLLRKMFRALQMRIGINPPIYSLHHLRHSIASHLVDSGVDIGLVQQFLGHSNLETTQNYVTPIKKISYGNEKSTAEMGKQKRKEDRQNV